MTDREWYPVYEALCRSGRAGDDPRGGLLQPLLPWHRRALPECRHLGVHAVAAGDLFKDFPTLRFVIPHGGGAVPYHWGRYRGMSLEMANRPLEGLLDNVFFDTCVYHQPGVELLTKVVPTSNVLFGSEMIGAVRGKDPKPPASISTTPSATSTACAA
jgi:4-oxalmesaconate hydratase